MDRNWPAFVYTMYPIDLSTLRMYTCAALNGFKAVTVPARLAVPGIVLARGRCWAAVCTGAAQPLTRNAT